MWNIASGYEHYSNDFASYDEIVSGLVSEGRWKHRVPVRYGVVNIG